jgi:hypothetical protein
MDHEVLMQNLEHRLEGSLGGRAGQSEGGSAEGSEEMDGLNAPTIFQWVELVGEGLGDDVTMVDLPTIESSWAEEFGWAPDEPAEEREGGNDGEDDDVEVVDEAEPPAGDEGGVDLANIPTGDDLRGGGRMMAVIQKYQGLVEPAAERGYEADSFVDDSEYEGWNRQRKEVARLPTTHDGFFVQRGDESFHLESVAGDDGDEGEGEKEPKRDMAAEVSAFVEKHVSDPLPFSGEAARLFGEVLSAMQVGARKRRSGVLNAWPLEADKPFLAVAEHLENHKEGSSSALNHPGCLARVMQGHSITARVCRKNVNRIRLEAQVGLMSKQCEHALSTLRGMVLSRLAAIPEETMMLSATKARAKQEWKKRVKKANAERLKEGRPVLTKEEEEDLAHAEPSGKEATNWFDISSAMQEHIHRIRAMSEQLKMKEVAWRKLLTIRGRSEASKQAQQDPTWVSGVIARVCNGSVEPADFAPDKVLDKKYEQLWTDKIAAMFPPKSVSARMLRGKAPKHDESSSSSAAAATAATASSSSASTPTSIALPPAKRVALTVEEPPSASSSRLYEWDVFKAKEDLKQLLLAAGSSQG